MENWKIHSRTWKTAVTQAWSMVELKFQGLPQYFCGSPNHWTWNKCCNSSCHYGRLEKVLQHMEKRWYSGWEHDSCKIPRLPHISGLTDTLDTKSMLLVSCGPVVLEKVLQNLEKWWNSSMEHSSSVIPKATPYCLVAQTSGNKINVVIVMPVWKTLENPLQHMNTTKSIMHLSCSQPELQHFSMCWSTFSSCP